MTSGPSKDTGLRYEVAIDVIGAIISHHAEAISLESRKPSPDQNLIARCEAIQDEMRDLRYGLAADDTQAIERVIATYGPEAKNLFKREAPSA